MEKNSIVWPSSKKAAVSICYDDGRPSNLDVVIPELERRGFKGTFFLTPSVYSQYRPWGWRRAFQQGHEIANHTWSHPGPEKMHTYTAEQFSAEQTGPAEQWMNDNVGYDEERTFAYPEAFYELGTGAEAPERYTDLVRRTFLAGRNGSGLATSPAEVWNSPYHVEAGALTWDNDDPKRSIDYCEDALSKNSWAILAFHDVVLHQPIDAGETSLGVHSEILDYLACKEDEFWIAPFRTVFRHIMSQKIAVAL